MTNEQKQQIKARFWGDHIGCKYQYVNPDFPKMTPAIFINCGLIKDDSNYRVRNENGFNKQAFEDCKLILRPLASITDDEAIECAKIYDADLTWKIYKRNEYFVQVENSDLELFTIWFPRDDTSLITLIDVADNTFAFNQFECIDFLRSKSFAIPFQGLDPIAENWAVLEPETPQP